jgi:hypothetical protein
MVEKPGCDSSTRVQRRWSGGFAASPTVADGAVFLGDRTGAFLRGGSLIGLFVWWDPVPS